MRQDYLAVGNAYLEQLGAEDVALIESALPRDLRPRARQDLTSLYPGGFDELLGRPELFEAVFGPRRDVDPLLGASPFLVFAVAVHRAGAELASTSYVSEWLGPGRWAPVFDVDLLRDFMSAPWRRLFLVELLTSYTHVASGSVVVSTSRGLRRHRFSELDPVRLSGLLELVSESERPGILRRLGDLALFLTGVFPDYTARRGIAPIDEARLLRASGLRNGDTTGRSSGDAMAVRRAGSELSASREAPAAFGDGGAVGLLEQLGRRWYRGAFQLLAAPVSGNVAVIGELPERFGQARRVLGLVTERFLFPHRDRWFGIG
jgi:hypothetical protein